MTKCFILMFSSFKTVFLVNTLSHFFHTFSFSQCIDFLVLISSSGGAWGEVGDFFKPGLFLSLSHEKIVRSIKVFLTMLHSFVQSEFWEHILFSLYFHKIYLIYSILRIPLMWSVSGAQYKNISFLYETKCFHFLDT